MSKKRNHTEYSASVPSNITFNGTYNDRNNKEKKNLSTREEIRELTKIVKEFNSKSLEGVKKTNFHQDRLTALGSMYDENDYDIVFILIIHYASYPSIMFKHNIN
jgi:hypothetical protein